VTGRGTTVSCSAAVVRGVVPTGRTWPVGTRLNRRPDDLAMT
jgi:hypothetical protein